jgi:hypothetical protein
MHLKVGETDGKCVCGIRFGGFNEAEQCSDHISDLSFLCCSPADDGLFDPPGRVFVDRRAAPSVIAVRVFWT